MIHPINLPEELLAANPCRPSLMELRRKPRITYTPEGRKMHDGRPTSPRTPTGLWNSALVRGFVHRMAYDVKAEVEETSSVESLIDVIDLQPPTITEPDLPDFSGLSMLIPDRPSIPDNDIEPQFALSLKSSGDFLQETDKGPKIIRRSSAQFQKPRGSAMIDLALLSPILQPCCSSSELSNFLLKEFLRFDFSNSQVFSGFCDKTSDDLKVSECNAETDKDIQLLPNTIGSRIWFNKPLSKSNSFGKNFGLSFSRSGSATRAKLCFAIQAVNVSDNSLNIKVLAHSSHPKEMKLETSLHLHAAKDQTIGRRFLAKDMVFDLENTGENMLEISLDLNEESMKTITLEPDEYVVITLLGYVHC